MREVRSTCVELLTLFRTPPEHPPLGVGVAQTITVESSEIIAAVYGGNSTISGGEDVVLDLTASIDPDEVCVATSPSEFTEITHNLNILSTQLQPGGT